MPLPYCFIHDRLLNPHTRTWMPWEHAQGALAQQACSRREATPCDVLVVHTACDRCVAITRQVLAELAEPL